MLSEQMLIPLHQIGTTLTKENYQNVPEREPLTLLNGNFHELDSRQSKVFNHSGDHVYDITHLF